MTSTTSDHVVIEDLKSTSQIAQACRLWDICFGSPYDIHQAQEYAEKHLTHNLGAVQDGTVMAVSAVIMFDMRFGDKYVPCGGIAGVATHPSFRRKGLTRKLIDACLSRLHAEKVPISALWPFSYPFYESLGWMTTDLEYQVDIDVTSLLRFAAGGNPGNYREISVDEGNRLFDLHDRWCDQWNLSIKRNVLRWERTLRNDQCNWLLLLHKDGYMVINLKKCTGGVFEIKEWCYLTEGAFVDGLALLSQLDSQYSKVRWTAGEIDKLLAMGVPYPVPKISVIPGMMTRVLNVQAFEELLPGKVLGSELRIVDPLRISDYGGGSSQIGPGQLMQLVTGFGPRPQDPACTRHHQSVATQKAFSFEKF